MEGEHLELGRLEEAEGWRRMRDGRGRVVLASLSFACLSVVLLCLLRGLSPEGEAAGLEERGRDGQADLLHSSEYEQWLRAASLRSWFGQPSAGHEEDQTDKTRFLSRRDCAAALQYSIAHVAKDCRFPCEPCEPTSEGSPTWRARCSLIFEGYCAVCGGCPRDQYRHGCGGPHATVYIDYSDKNLSSYEDVLAVGLDPRAYEGTCLLCPPCSLGMYRMGCGGTEVGRCEDCLSSRCREGWYRRGCEGTSMGECQECETCDAEQYREGCGGLSAGVCLQCSTCSSDEFESAPCSSTTDRQCDKCASLITCPVGQYRASCGGGRRGECEECARPAEGWFRRGCGGMTAGEAVECESCPVGFYRDGCEGLEPGSCRECGACEEGFWRRGCGGLSPGTCEPCGECGPNFYRQGCRGLEPGTCAACRAAGELQYDEQACSSSRDAVVANCSLLPSCPAAQYRRGCGRGHAGECVSCPQPPRGFYQLGCSLLSPGVTTRCPDCSPGSYREGCEGGREGSCRACETCASGYYRKGCGWTEPGECVACEECGPEKFRVGCGGQEGGECRSCRQCKEDEYEEVACSSDHDRECSTCSQLQACDSLQYRAGCGSGSQGSCVACGECPVGSFRVGCEGQERGSCSACEGCPAGSYRDGCSFISGGSCRPCGECPSESFRSDCAGVSAGACQPCRSCGGDEYETSKCGGRGDRECGPCSELASCAPGYFRDGCGGGEEGECRACQPCPAGLYRVGCEGTSRGTCVPCEETCGDGHFLQGCGGLTPGTCAACPTCSTGFFLEGCQGSHAGGCVSCESLLCSSSEERVMCGGTSSGMCVRKWLPYTPPPELIAWGAEATDVSSSSCVDTGANALPGVPRQFRIPQQILRLGPCTSARVRGEHKLKVRGNWLLQFYVAIPSFSSSAPPRPAAFPFESVGKPDPQDSLVVSINGVNETFLNSAEEEGGKRLFFHMFSDVDTLSFDFLFLSSNADDRLHLFVSNGQAAYLGDSLPLSAAQREQEGFGVLSGQVVNAVDGKELKPGGRVLSGYKEATMKHLKLWEEEADVRLMLGTTSYVQVRVRKGSMEEQRVPSGKFVCQVSFPGFYNFFDPTCEVDNNGKLKKRIALCPFLNPGHARFVLSWQSKPEDMDFHLLVPGAGGRSCEISWRRKECQQARLDFDVTDGFGPETITIEGFSPGTYVLWVEHYHGFGDVDKRTNRDNTLEMSEAIVTVYLGSESHRFLIGKDGYTSGINWMVLSIDGESMAMSRCSPDACPPPLSTNSNY